jgi:hypothetical protein
VDATLLQLIQSIVDLSQEANRLQAQVLQLAAERDQYLAELRTARNAPAPLVTEHQDGSRR